MEDLMQACEGLAANVAVMDVLDGLGADSRNSPADEDIERWVNLFGMTAQEAAKEIANWRSDLSRKTLSDEIWTFLKGTVCDQGYDKEAYEYSTSPGYLGKKKKKKRYERRTMASPNAKYILKLEGSLGSPQVVQQLAQIERVPEVEKDDISSALFVVVSGAAKEKILQALCDRGEAFEPTFVRITKAAKELSDSTLYPTLGVDTTLPQFRANQLPVDLAECIPRQKQYPVPYLFYGTLADQEFLGRLLNRDPESIFLRPGRVRSGQLVSWAGKYKGLVDADSSRYVDG